MIPSLLMSVYSEINNDIKELKHGKDKILSLQRRIYELRVSRPHAPISFTLLMTSAIESEQQETFQKVPIKRKHRDMSGELCIH